MCICGESIDLHDVNGCTEPTCDCTWFHSKNEL